MIETRVGSEGEAQGMYTDIRQPSNKAVDLDFEIDSSKGYTHVTCYMGKKISPQKEKFCSLSGCHKI